MVWKELLRRVFAPLYRLLGSTQDVGDPAPAVYSKILRGSNPPPFTEGTRIRFRRREEGSDWELAVQPRHGEWEVLGENLTFEAGTWSGPVTIDGGQDTLYLSQSRPLGRSRRRFLFGLVVDEISFQQEQGTWGAEEEEEVGDVGTNE